MIEHEEDCPRCGATISVSCDATFGDWFRAFWRECWDDPMKTIPLAVLSVFVLVVALTMGG